MQQGSDDVLVRQQRLAVVCPLGRRVLDLSAEASQILLPSLFERLHGGLKFLVEALDQHLGGEELVEIRVVVGLLGVWRAGRKHLQCRKSIPHGLDQRHSVLCASATLGTQHRAPAAQLRRGHHERVDVMHDRNLVSQQKVPVAAAPFCCFQEDRCGDVPLRKKLQMLLAQALKSEDLQP